MEIYSKHVSSKLLGSLQSLPNVCVATKFADVKYLEDKNGFLMMPLDSLLQLHITISPEKVKLNVDCQEVAEKPIKEANNITLEGYEVLGKMVKSGGGKKQSATVSKKDT